MSLMHKWTYVVVLALISVIALAAIYEIGQHQISTSTAAPQNEKTMYQISAYSIMAAGDYDGPTTFAELEKHGDFGIGAFQDMNGEMILLNGTAYQITTDGIPRLVDPSTHTPFATVTFFQADQILHVNESMNYTELKTYIDSNLPTLNGTYAIKVSGTFSYAKTRSVPIQTQPYPPLTDVVVNQTVFELNNIRGTLAGYRCPSYSNGISFAGYHFHFITDDKTAGGHMLELTTQNITIEIDHIRQFQIQDLP